MLLSIALFLTELVSSRYDEICCFTLFSQHHCELGIFQVAQLAQETYNANVLPLLIRNLTKLDFESKKDVALIFNNLLRRQIGTRSPTVEYLCARPEILLILVKG